jgi:hypothetical protein
MIGFSLSFASVVVNNKTNLMWQDNSSAKSVKKNWQSAKNYCSNLVVDRYSDWYLPTVEQLLTINDKDKYDPAIKEAFNNVASDYYWSSSPFVVNSKVAWYVDFKRGNSRYGSKEGEHYVRCARAGQSDTFNFKKLTSKIIEQELKKIPKPRAELKLEKDEFETTAEFNKRVAKTKKNQKDIVAKYKKSTHL